MHGRAAAHGDEIPAGETPATTEHEDLVSFKILRRRWRACVGDVLLGGDEDVRVGRELPCHEPLIGNRSAADEKIDVVASLIETPLGVHEDDVNFWMSAAHLRYRAKQEWPEVRRCADAYRAAYAALIGLPACGTSSAQAATDETAAIKDVVLQYGTALSADNVTDVMKVYEADAVVAPPGQSVNRGAAEVSKFYEGLFAGADVTLAFTIEQVTADGNFAYVISHSNGTLKFKDGSPDFNGVGRELFVLRKTAGVWKIAAYWFNN